MKGEKKEKFEKAVDKWLEEGILIPLNGAVENGILPLMAVEQPSKVKLDLCWITESLIKGLSVIQVTMFLMSAPRTFVDGDK